MTMLPLGFVSAILPDLSLEEVLAFAAAEGFACVEPMCWPPGVTDRRYGGVCHVDCTALDAAHVRNLLRIHGVEFSGLGYYPNPLDPDPAHRAAVAEHLHRVIDAAAALDVGVVNTFIGSDWHRAPDAQWDDVAAVWTPLFDHAKAAGVTIAIEHCPMLFTADEWPGGKNLAHAPALWRELFRRFPAAPLALNFDPSHLLYQGIDAARAVREFAPRIKHVHLKDEAVDRERLYEVGVTGLGWHTPRLPGLGDVDWRAVFAALVGVGYRGPVCIEVEDRAYEGSLADRQAALRQSARFVRPFLP